MESSDFIKLLAFNNAHFGIEANTSLLLNVLASDQHI